MKKRVIMAALAAMVWGVTAAAQEPPPSPPRSPSSPTNPKQVQNVPLELQVVIARYQGDKRVGSLPYVLSLKSTITSRDFRPDSAPPCGSGRACRSARRSWFRLPTGNPRRRAIGQL